MSFVSSTGWWGTAVEIGWRTQTSRKSSGSSHHSSASRGASCGGGISSGKCFRHVQMGGGPAAELRHTGEIKSLNHSWFICTYGKALIEGSLWEKFRIHYQQCEVMPSQLFGLFVVLIQIEQPQYVCHERDLPWAPASGHITEQIVILRGQQVNVYPLMKRQSTPKFTLMINRNKGQHVCRIDKGKWVSYLNSTAFIHSSLSINSQLSGSANDTWCMLNSSSFD